MDIWCNFVAILQKFSIKVPRRLNLATNCLSECSEKVPNEHALFKRIHIIYIYNIDER